jgi:hypothetical protein
MKRAGAVGHQKRRLERDRAHRIAEHLLVNRRLWSIEHGLLVGSGRHGPTGGEQQQKPCNEFHKRSTNERNPTSSAFRRVAAGRTNHLVRSKVSDQREASSRHVDEVGTGRHPAECGEPAFLSPQPMFPRISQRIHHCSLFRAPRFCVNTWVVSFCGGEYIFGSWSAKLEYLHVDFGSQLFSRILIADGFFFAGSVTLTDDVVRAGVNFGWGGPVAAAADFVVSSAEGPALSGAFLLGLTKKDAREG